MQLNQTISTIEMWLPTKSQLEIVIIKPEHLHAIQVKEWVFSFFIMCFFISWGRPYLFWSNVDFTFSRFHQGSKLAVHFELSSPPEYKTNLNRVKKSFGKSISITFTEYHHISKEDLISLFVQMVRWHHFKWAPKLYSIKFDCEFNSVHFIFYSVPCNRMSNGHCQFERR